jgi:hypothetical protein
MTFSLGDGFHGARGVPESLQTYPEQGSGYVFGIRPEVPEGQHWRGPLSPDGYPVLYPKVSGFLRFAPSSYGMCAPRAVLRLLRTIVALLHAVLRASLWPSAATAVAYSPLAWFWAIAYSVHGARAVR